MATTSTQTLTEAQPSLTLRPSVTEKVAEPGVNLDDYDEEQARLMEERCILVTPEDVAYGEDSKKTCKSSVTLYHTACAARAVAWRLTDDPGHLMTNIANGLLHRAFSVFLFRPSDGRLLLQRRADEKITFPGMWTNTCCSHPLSIKAELVEEGQAGESRVQAYT